MISGITLAVASAVAATVLADTQQAQVNLRFDLQRSDHVVIQGDNLPPDGFPSTQVSLADHISPVSGIGELSIWTQAASATRSVPSIRATAPVVVADVGGLRASGTSVTAGASLALMSGTSRTRSVWVGTNLASKLGVSPVDPGHPSDAQVIVNGVPFSVAGIVSNDGSFGYLSSAIVMTRRTALSTLRGEGENVRLVAHVRPGSAAVVATYLLRSIDLSGDMGLRNVTPPDGTELVGNVGRDLRRVGAALAAIIGLVGMMSVANTLMLSVHQRLRELGLRSAMGWSRRRIGLLVLTESAAAGLLAGILGSGLGLAAASSWSWLQGWTLIVSPTLPAVIVAAATVASLMGGLVPALRASSISPLTAMKS